MRALTDLMKVPYKAKYASLRDINGHLNTEDDELENINILELEKAKEYQERKKRKPVYDVYDDIQSDKKSILAQYDEKPDRAVRTSIFILPFQPIVLIATAQQKFKLDEQGRVEEDVETKLDRVREKLKANRKILYDISGPAASLAPEYQTQEEATPFKAPREKKVLLSLYYFHGIFSFLS